MSATAASESSLSRRWRLALLGAILMLAGFLRLHNLGQEGFGNLYYAAAVRSMLTGWRAFYFVSFDPAGFVSVDKPPLGLWIQAASAWLLGFHGWSLLLPQALAGILSVALVYHLARRNFGELAGLLAALILALTPVAVAADRNNTMDSTLLLTSLLAAWAGLLAAERGRLRWLLLCAVLVGIGFNIKMLQAVLVLPAVFAPYLFAAPLSRLKRLLHLALAGLLLVVVSLCWVISVDLTPAGQRPYVGSSENNTVTELIAGHNGAERLGLLAGLLGLPPPGQPRGEPGQPGIYPGQPGGPGGSGQPLSPSGTQAPAGPGMGETGPAGPLRLYSQALAGQVSWLLPLALVGLLAAALARPSHAQRLALLLWALWLLPQIIFFSFAGLFHRYYLIMPAPAVAVLAGAGLAAMVGGLRACLTGEASRRQRLLAWLLPLALLLTSVLEALILSRYPLWNAWLLPATIALALAAAAGLGVLLLVAPPGGTQNRRTGRLGSILTGLGLLALLLGPAAWALTLLLYGGDANLPFAGPELGIGRQGPGLADVSRQAGYLLEQRQGETFILATLNAQAAAPYILASGQPVMAMGGFSGGDHILEPADLQRLVQDGQVRFFLLPVERPGPPNPGQGGPQPPNPQDAQSALIRWVRQNCHPVQVSGSPGAGTGGDILFWDCRQP